MSRNRRFPAIGVDDSCALTA